ncbi:MAG: hypothetical protein WKF82_07645 [Nocardioidaceae bacterium]
MNTTEDNGSIQQASRTGINKSGEGSIRLRSQIGDGPHGSQGDGSGDFDIYKVGAHAGQLITANSLGSDISTVLVVYEQFGSDWDWTEVGLPRRLRYAVPEDGDSYYILVAASDSYLVDPTDSGSGAGVEPKKGHTD